MKKMYWVLDLEMQDQDYCTLGELLYKADFSEEEIESLVDLEIGWSLNLGGGKIKIVRQE